MLKKHSPREKELLKLSGLIGESHNRLRHELVTVEKLMRLLIYNGSIGKTEEKKQNYKIRIKKL